MFKQHNDNMKSLINIEYKKSFGIKYPYYQLNDFNGREITGLVSLQLFPEIHSIIEIRVKNHLKIRLEQRIEQERLKEEQRLKELQVSKTNVLSELDKDGNGEVDVVEGSDFNLLLKKHQKSIVEVDRNYVQQFVKVSSYLKTKSGDSIHFQFLPVKETSKCVKGICRDIRG